MRNMTIELVGRGHPDRFCDILAERILVEHLKHDETAKIAVEIMATRNSVILGGEVTSTFSANYENILDEVGKDIYGDTFMKEWNPKIINRISEQSKELEVIQQNDIVAGDQGVIYGYWNKKRFKIILDLYEIMKFMEKEYSIFSDWKLLYNTEENILSMSVCKVDEKGLIIIKNSLLKEAKKILPELKRIVVNPKGVWLIGGPLSDTGVVGRKLMIDTFGAGIPHGGGAFCGKCLSKVDKTGIIIATDIARNHGKGDVVVELNYMIGDKLPKIIISSLHGKEIVDELFKGDINKYSLSDYITNNNLLNIDWYTIAKNGGIIYYFKDYIL